MKKIKGIVFILYVYILFSAGTVYPQARDTLFVVAIVPDSPETAAGIEFGLVKDKALISDFADMMVKYGIVRKKQLVLLDGRQATRDNFLGELGSVNPGKNDLLCVFVTCHGGLWGQTKSQFFALQESSISREELNDIILGKKSDFKMLITDACANSSDNYIVKSRKFSGLSEQSVENLKRLFGYKGYFSMSASTEGKVAWIYDFGGAFIYSLLKNVLGSAPPDDWQGVVDKTERLVDEINEQHPRAYSIPTLSGTDERPDSEYVLYNPDYKEVTWDYDRGEEKRALKGLWEFNDMSNPLTASMGKDLVLKGTQFFVQGTGPGDGAVRIGKGSYFICEHGFKPEPGSRSVNRYSIVMDVRIQDPEIYHSLFQTNEANVNDTDFCIRKFDGLMGISMAGYSQKSVKPGHWYRLAVTVDNTRNVFYGYLDGEKILDGVPQEKDGQFSLGKTILFFADDDGEDGLIDVSRIRLYDVALHPETIAGLGRLGPSDEKPVMDRTVEKAMVGLWEFNNSANPLRATVGKDLVLYGRHKVIPGKRQGDGAVQIGEGSYYSAVHGIPASPSFKYVNAYTLFFDIRVPDRKKYYAFFQTNEDNLNDAEVFVGVNDGKIGVSATGYSDASIIAGKWTRIAVAVDTAKDLCDYYMDGKKIHHGTGQAVDGRFSLSEGILFFADDNGEDGVIDVSRIAMYNYALSGTEIGTMGTVDTADKNTAVKEKGYDVTVASSSLKGLWEFNDSGNLLKATRGSNLVLKGKHSIVRGPGNQGNAVRVGKGSYYEYRVDSVPDRGDKSINRYTIVMDVKIGSLDEYHTLFQTNGGNANDGDVFIEKGTGKVGVADTGYSNAAVRPGAWCRIAVVVDNRHGIFDYYLNGKKILKGEPQAADGRFSIDDRLLFFADDDGEDGTIDVAAIAFYDSALGEKELGELGGI
ncbi:MAG: hypothetical protein JW969_13350 [Spirochaetales bacterium]|nr:hypothetical protein [Spirochaetales bacterium]